MPWKNMPRNNWTQCGLRPGCSTTDQIFTLQQIFEKSWEYAKDVYTCFVDLEKAYDRVTREKLVECFGKTVLTTACYWPSSHCIPAQKFLSLSAELNHNRSPLVLYCDKQGRIQWGSDCPPKPKKVTYFHHDFVEFGKKHSRHKAIWSSIVLSQQCCEVYFISLTVVNP